MQHERATEGGSERKARRFNKMYKKYNQTAVPSIDLNSSLIVSIVKMKNMLLSVDFSATAAVVSGSYSYFPAIRQKAIYERFYVKPIMKTARLDMLNRIFVQFQ